MVCHKSRGHSGTVGRACSTTCAPANIAKMLTAFTRPPPHHTVTLNPLQNLCPEPRPFSLSCSMKFLFWRPDFGRTPSISYFVSQTHTHRLFWFLLLLWSSVLFQFLLSLYISWAPTVMKDKDKYNLFYISVFILYREIYSVYVGCAYCSTFITCLKH